MIALWLLAASCGDRTGGPDDVPCTDTFFPDEDGDGHGDAARPTTACAVPSGYTTTSDDCDDADAAIHPDADERCNGLDDDCDTAIDDDAIDGTAFYVDADLDGFGTGVAVVSCTELSGHAAIAGDCADDDPDVNPDASEICNALDDDCNGAIDSLDPGLEDGSVYYADADGDGYGDPATGVRACEEGKDRTLDDSDCNDLAATANPEGTEVCGTGIDEDCDLTVDNCVLSSPDADVLVEGPEVTFGQTIGVLDLNVDGVSDLVLSSWFQLNQAGVVYVAYGPVTAGTTTDDMVALTADVEDGYFGWKVAGGDANGDGLDDLLVGAAQDTLADAYLFLGPVTADGDRTDADAVLDGDVDTATGTDVDVVSDFDGDGLADLVIGAPDVSRFSGAVYVVSGPVSGHVPLTDATYTFEGIGRDDSLGAASASLGDTNGDGFDEMAVGAPYDGNGTVYVVDGGGSSGTYAIDTVASSSLAGPEFESAFGSALTSADYDGDGSADLLVAACWADAPGNDEAGAVYAFLGPFSDAVDTADADATWASDDPEVLGFGFDVAAGDVDADGQVDVLIGAPYIGGVSTDGLAYVQLGFASGTVAAASLVTIEGRSREGLGMGVAFVPDWTGDGGAEVAIGGPDYRDASGDSIGALHLFESERFHP